MKTLLTSCALAALLTTAASAADLPRRAAPPIFTEVPVFSWTGVFIGSHTSYAFSDRQRIVTTGNDFFSQAIIAAGIVPGTVTTQQDRLAKFGGGFGYNYQLTPGSGFVIGAAVNVDWTDLRRTTIAVGNPILPGIGIASAFTQNLNYLGTVNGRLGYAFDRVLVYATGGLAFGNVDYTVNGFLQPGGFLAATGGTTGIFETGYNYGGGIEYAIPSGSLLGKFDLLELVGIKIGGTSTLKAEYIRYDLGSRNILVNDLIFGSSATSRFRTEGSIIRAGFNYKFP